MYANVEKYRVDPISLFIVMHRIQQNFIPIISDAPGFIDYYLVDPGDGTLLSISVFKDEKTARESCRMAADWMKDNILPLLSEPLEDQSGEIKLTVSSKIEELYRVR
jgi:hypothetical protein